MTPVTRGARLASFFWIQSMVRDDGQRALLFDFDMAINQASQATPDHPERRGAHQLLPQPAPAVGRRLTV